MKKRIFKLSFHLENEEHADADNLPLAIAKTLRDISVDIQRFISFPDNPRIIRDINGNTIGDYRITGLKK